MYLCTKQEAQYPFYLFILKKRKNKMKIIACGQIVKSLYLGEKDDLIYCINYSMMLNDKELNNNYLNYFLLLVLNYINSPIFLHHLHCLHIYEIMPLLVHYLNQYDKLKKNKLSISAFLIRRCRYKHLY